MTTFFPRVAFGLALGDCVLVAGLAATPASARTGRDPSYPDVCIPPAWAVGDLDCYRVPYGNSPVYPSDPHGFDGDSDGVGCESG